jgi:CRISPR/Cas system-associated exonuclease Cas4 (RecB family)
MADDLIRASEIGEYIYCHRAWWLRHVQGVEPENLAVLERGRKAHGRHARRVERVALATLAARLLVLVAAILLIAAFALWWQA